MYNLKKPYSWAMINPSIQDLGRLVRYAVYLTVVSYESSDKSRTVSPPWHL